jgi:hypothetical protein
MRTKNCCIVLFDEKLCLFYSLVIMTKLAIAVFGCTSVPRYYKEAEASLNTWANIAKKHNVPVLFYVGRASKPVKHFEDNFVVMPNTADDYHSATPKAWFSMVDIYQKHSPDFIFSCGSDTYVEVDKVLKLLEQYNADEPLYIGGHGDVRRVLNHNLYFHSGGSGFLLSRAIMPQIIQHYKEWQQLWSAICATPNAGIEYLHPACDVAVAYFVQKVAKPPARVITHDNLFYACNIFGQPCHIHNINYGEACSYHLMTPFLMKLHYLQRDKAIDCDLNLDTRLIQVNDLDRQKTASQVDQSSAQAPVAELAFVILRHVRSIADHKRWRKCYTSIRKYYSDTPIIVIDDASAFVDDDFENRLLQSSPATTFIKSEFPGAGEILPYYYYLQHRWAKKIVVLHDSMFIIRKLNQSEIQSKDGVKFIYSFEEHHHNDTARICNLIKMLPNAEMLLEMHNRPTDWCSCFGVCSIIDLETLQLTESLFHWTSVLVQHIKTREDRMALERIFGIIHFAAHLVYSKDEVAIFGLINNVPNAFYLRAESLEPYTDEELEKQGFDRYPIVKTWVGR